MKFDSIGDCERCKREAAISSNGICEPCLLHMLAIRKDPVLRKRRLRQLNQSENGIRRSVRQEMALKTHQSSPKRGINLNQILNARDRIKTIRAANRERIAAAIEASTKQLSDARNVEPLVVSFNTINAALVKHLANKPEDFHKLHPRKFEELVCEILTDQGHAVELTPESKDGGRHLVVIMKTPLGEMLVVVECKRWAINRPVGLDIIERFLYNIREKSRANSGLIVATTRFTSGAIKAAREHNYQLRLNDLEKLTEMAKHFGSWRKKENSNIWIPNY